VEADREWNEVDKLKHDIYGRTTSYAKQQDGEGNTLAAAFGQPHYSDPKAGNNW
jgi:hypothetical protein